MIKIFLVVSQKIVREGVRTLLEEEPDFQVFASESKDVKISLINSFKPDLILISLDNLDKADFDYLSIFHHLNNNSYQDEDFNQIKVIVYAARVNEFILNKALQLGCDGYLLKECSIEELKQAIRSVFNGYKHIGNSVFNQLKQLPLTADSSNKVLEANLSNKSDSYQTGLVTTSTKELDVENFNFNHQQIPQPEIQEAIIAGHPPKSSTVSITKHSVSRWESWLENLGSSLLLISLGCLAGIIGVLFAREQATKSFSPITKNGVVEGEIIPIKSPSLGKIKQLPYKVGDLVQADTTIAKLEPQNNESKKQIIAEKEQQIEKIKQQIEQQKQLLSITQSHFNGEQQKLEKLLVNNSKVTSSKSSTSDKSLANFQIPEEDVQEEVKVALTNYRQLQKLKQQNAISEVELERAKQVWTAAKSKLTLIQNNQQNQWLNFLEKEAQAKTKKEQNITYLLSNIEGWKTQVSQLENTVELLVEDLDRAKKHLTEVKNSYQNQELINLKSPFTGVIHQTNQVNNKLLERDQTIIELINCNSLWIEVIVDANVLAKIDLQQSATLKFNNPHQPTLSGKIASLHPVHSSQESLDINTANMSNLKDNSTRKHLDLNSLYKIKIDYSITDDYMKHDESCSLKKNAIVVFNKESVVPEK